MSAHARYEALAGALILNEATPAERAEFGLHVAGCTGCSSSYAGATAAATALREAQAAETWRPHLRDAVMERIERHRAWRLRWTVNGLALAAGLVFALHVGVVTGLSARAIEFVRVAGGTVVAIVAHGAH